MKLRFILGLCLVFCLQACSLKGSKQDSIDSNSSTRNSSQDKSKKNEILYHPRGIDYAEAPAVVGFGSCIDQRMPQPIWNVIGSVKPDLFLMMGDNVYADKPETKPISEQYKKQDRVIEYQKVRVQVPFMATWDDGDYGWNDGGADSPEKDTAKKEFLNYWPYVVNSRPLNTEGIYHSKMIGDGSYSEKGRGKRKKYIRKPSPVLQVIMLDTRWFRSKALPSSLPKQFKPNTDPSSTMLGATQWEWLEDELQKPADFRLLVSSVQLIPNGANFEKWGNFPHERQRFFDLLVKYKVKNLVILSGDRHIAAISKIDLKGLGSVYEITSSSLNKPKNIPPEEDPTYLAPSFGGENFGLAKFDWKKKSVRFELKDIEGKTFQSLDLPFRK